MSFKIVEYEALREAVIKSIYSLAREHGHKAKALIDAYGKGNPNPALLALEYSDIPQERRMQIEFLLTVIYCLDAATDSPTRAICLNAAAFYIRELIEESYDPDRSLTNYIASYVTSVDSSYLFTLLGNALKIDRNNFPSAQELREMYSELKDLVMANIYVDPDNLGEGYLALSAQHFSKEKIEGFKAEEFVKKMIKRNAQLETNCIDLVKQNKVSSIGVLKHGVFGGKKNNCSQEIKVMHEGLLIEQKIQ